MHQRGFGSPRGSAVSASPNIVKIVKIVKILLMYSLANLSRISRINRINRIRSLSYRTPFWQATGECQPTLSQHRENLANLANPAHVFSCKSEQDFQD